MKTAIGCGLLVTTNMYDSVDSGLDVPLISKTDTTDGLNIINVQNVHITNDYNKVMVIRRNQEIIGSMVVDFEKMRFK